jgi:N-succinyl-L-ornithine transcarbamylase
MPEVNENWMMDLNKYQLTNNAGIMHCLPVRRDVELSSKLIDHPNSLIQKQASNRVFAAQIVLKNLLENMSSSTTKQMNQLSLEEA